MAILSKGRDFTTGDQVTATNLDAHVDEASFVAGGSGTTDDSSLEVNGSGRLQIKDSGVTAGKIGASAVTTVKLAASSSTTDGVTFPKMRYMKDLSVIGNVSGASAAPSEVDILDEDDLASDSATSIPTQQSVKAYIDNGEAFGGAYTGGESVTLPNGLIMKMGSVNTTGVNEHTVTYGTAFPTGVVSIQLTANRTGSGALDVNPQVYGTPTTSAFTFRQDNGTQFAENTYWTAIGY